MTARIARSVDGYTAGVDAAGRTPPGDVNAISGFVSNFELSGNEVNEWAMNLQGTVDAIYHGLTRDDTHPHIVGAGSGGGEEPPPKQPAASETTNSAISIRSFICSPLYEMRQ